MNENLENTKDNLEIVEPWSNKYSTRKKIIDFAKIGEKLSLTGSNCHFCKSIMCVQDSNACRNTEKINNTKKKTCNKKFCYDCLQKNFPSFWDSRSSKDWKCPCCLNECPCSQCKKVWVKLKNWKEQSEIEEEKFLKRKSNSIENLEYDEEDEDNSKYSGDREEHLPLESGKNIFDINSIHSILYNSKISTEKLAPIPRPKIEMVSETLFLAYRKAKDDYLSVLEFYKDKLIPIDNPDQDKKYD